MTKREVLQEAGTILLVWLAALGVIFILPDVLTTQKYLLASAASVLAIVVLTMYFGWQKISGLSKSWLTETLFVVRTIFYFYAGYFFWTLVLSVWQVPPVVNGYYVVTWFSLFLVAVLIVGALSNYMGIKNVMNWYYWRRNRQKKSKRPKGQSAVSP